MCYLAMHAYHIHPDIQHTIETSKMHMHIIYMYNIGKAGSGLRTRLYGQFMSVMITPTRMMCTCTSLVPFPTCRLPSSTH